MSLITASRYLSRAELIHSLSQGKHVVMLVFDIFCGAEPAPRNGVANPQFPGALGENHSRIATRWLKVINLRLVPLQLLADIGEFGFSDPYSSLVEFIERENEALSLVDFLREK
jgi:hypothetical protein